MFGTLVPLVTLPLFGLLMWNYRRAKRIGLALERSSGRSNFQSVATYNREFDAIDLLLVSMGVALVLFPFNAYALVEEGWSSPFMVDVMALGVFSLLAFTT
jgi:hypothetical protein